MENVCAVCDVMEIVCVWLHKNKRKDTAHTFSVRRSQDARVPAATRIPVHFVLRHIPTWCEVISRQLTAHTLLLFNVTKFSSCGQ